MHTHTNVVRASSLNWVLTSEMVWRSDSSFSIISGSDWPLGRVPPPPPRKPLSSGPYWVDSCDTLARAFSSTEGNCRKRSVWPVGAVSKMMASYESDLTCLSTSAKGHGFVDARDLRGARCR